ncbi:CPBP family intramembrane metalloprotease [Mycolicibacterium sp. CH28]|uniref:CPBP family intramembrane glutamic endopeptidase n=1 Tax=Mycolicibacterium sp. CH28 TaxID=2512237 RepID=UPI001081A0DE|nr:type II CAAX endopeptidase family protein [Mycolicibacterium sp. CH28]TGD85636.1 CPBP family intramembrane metalloprotease [Mycolicibacterium sp. CH28]
MTVLTEIREAAAKVAVPHQEWPSVVRRRRIVVCVVMVVGAALLGYSLTRTPGDATFYWLTLGLAAVWALGTVLSGPVHLGCIRWRGRNQRPVLTGLVVGLALGGVFVTGALVAREIGPVAERITRVLEFANHGSLLLVVTITLVNGFAEELFFRGALYTALGGFHPVLISTMLYAVVTSASGNPMLGFAAIVLGTVCGWERRATGGVLAPVLTHVVWGLIMVLALPPMFGLWG